MQAKGRHIAFSLKPAHAVALLLPLCSAPAALARDNLYGVLDNDALLACESQHWRGQETEADACFRNLAGSAQPPQIRAEALWALGDRQGANSQFQAAFNAFPEDPLVRVRWGELFMDTYQYQEAYNLFDEALQLDENNAWAHVGAASSLAEGGDPEALNAHLEAVMGEGLAPAGARLRAMIMVIRSRLRDDRYDEADTMLDEAFEFADDQDLPTMELKALRAAYAFDIRGDYQRWIDAALAESPTYSDAYFIPGYFATVIRRYKESVDFFRKAIEIEPDNWQAQVYLGQNLLRLNDINDAIEHVNISYEGDAFNPMTVNLMRLLDTFNDDFVNVSYPDPPEGPFPSLILRLGRDERDVLKDYASKLALKSMALYQERYHYEPKEPVVVEIYPNHEDFIVRSIGMPGVGLLGVTFGDLFAMDSPTAQGDPTYHWGTTLWHEMAHVYTLGATDNLVPRWVSEGISVYEEWRTGPIPGRKIPTDVLQAMAEGKFLPIAKLDDGFMRPTYQGQVIVSYMQAGLVFDFIDIEYGFDKIVDMLYLFNDGLTPVEAIEKSLGITDKEFDRHFKQFIDIEFGPLLSGINVWIQDMKDGFAALDEENWEEAAAAGERAIFTYPDYVENDSAYIIQAKAYEELGDDEAQFNTLQSYWQKGGYQANALMRLGDLYVEKGQRDDAEKVYMDANYVEPFREDVHIKLGDLYMDAGKPADALKEYNVLLALDPVDKASANYRVAKAYHALDNGEKSLEYLMTALDIAPQYRDAQKLLLELTRTQN